MQHQKNQTHAELNLSADVLVKLVIIKYVNALTSNAVMVKSAKKVIGVWIIYASIRKTCNALIMLVAQRINFVIRIINARTLSDMTMDALKIIIAEANNFVRICYVSTRNARNLKIAKIKKKNVSFFNAFLRDDGCPID